MYKRELMRLATFGNTASQFPSFSTSRLAQNGFYATGNNGEIKCFSCGFMYGSSIDQGDPIDLHHKQRCAFLSGNDVTNGEEGQPSRDSSYGEEGQSSGDIDRPGFAVVANRVACARDDRVQSDCVEVPNALVKKIKEDTHANAVRQRMGYIDHRLEICRLETFKNWPSNASVRPDDLANAGFFYLGSDDRVQCAFCRGILRNWEADDKALAKHLRHFPQCPFLSDPEEVGNVCLGEEDGSIFGNVALREEGGNFLQMLGDMTVQGIITDRPVNHRYAMPVERLATYKTFPSNTFQTPEDLTRAGFYYTNAVKCFFCDVFIHNWKPNDDPWIVHAKCSPRCGYLKLCKGEDFINDVQKNKRTNMNNTRLNKARKKRDKASLLEETQILREERLCRVCRDEMASMVFIKCGHLVCCSNCAPALKHCPICREIILGTIKVYIGTEDETQGTETVTQTQGVFTAPSKKGLDTSTLAKLVGPCGEAIVPYSPPSTAASIHDVGERERMDNNTQEISISNLPLAIQAESSYSIDHLSKRTVTRPFKRKRTLKGKTTKEYHDLKMKIMKLNKVRIEKETTKIDKENIKLDLEIRKLKAELEKMEQPRQNEP